MRAKKIIRASSVLLFVLLTLITILTVRTPQPQGAFESLGTSKALTEGWYTKNSDGNQNFVKLDELYFDRSEPSELTIYRSMSGQTDDVQQSLVFSTSGISFGVFLNDELIFQQGAFASDQGSGKDPGYGWHFVNLPRINAGDILRIDMYSGNGDGSEAIHEMYLGQSAVILRDLLKKTMFRLLMCLILSLVGMFLVFLHFMFNRVLKLKLDLFYIGIFFVIGGIYSSMHLTLPALFADNVEILNRFEYILMMAMPVFILAYVTRVCETKNRVLIGSAFTALVLNFTAQVLLDIFTRMTYHCMLFASHIVIIYTISVMLYTVNKDRFVYETGDTDVMLRKNLLFFGILVLFLSLAADILNLYMSGSSDATMYFRIGMMVLAVVVGIITAIETSNFTKRTAVLDILRSMAYTDQLTGLSNRTSFESKLDEIDGDKHALDNVAVIVFDVNNLKKVNDSYGHQEGDLLIKSAASAISDIFNADFHSYRTGGDEFAAIYTGKESSSYIEHNIDMFYRHVEHANESAPEHLKLSIAVGVAYMSLSSGESISSVFRRADRLMYENKREMKEKMRERQ